MKKSTSFLIFAILVSNFLFCQSIATYDIVFESIWDSELNDPTNGCSTIDLPASAHWSDLVGATHTTANTFFEIGEMASSGIESVAETGATSTFQGEINSSSDANQFINAGGLGSAKGTITISNLEVNENYPLLTLASMIAPSPDWFIGINSFNLRNGGSWINSATIDLYPYDAGTEDGSSYSLSNASTIPQGVIFNRSNTTPFNEKKIGTISISLKQVLNTTENNLKGVSLYPNPSDDYIIISTGNNVELIKFEIFNALGKSVKLFFIDKNKFNNKLDLTSINSGFYLVKITTKDNKNYTNRLIIK
ncbi:spondin domain-containing protein [Seonamhaeicola sp. MEBiC1930]|uniref:spondin domain-containing protein n=1 Tax=Seonamhaeicola sp. MEBiC01930 TaxID=2976768 RepID=UPI0032502FD0